MFLQVFSKKVCFCCILGCFAEKKLPQMSQILTDGACLEFYEFCVLWEYSSPTDCTDQHRWLVAWVRQGCHTLLHLCKSVLSVGDPSLQEASVKSVNSVGENHSKKVLCRSVKSVGENRSKKVLCRSVKSVEENHSEKVLCKSVKSVGENHSEKVLCKSVKSVGGNHSKKVL